MLCAFIMLARCLYDVALFPAPVAVFGECGRPRWTRRGRFIHQIKNALHQRVGGVFEGAFREDEQVADEIVHPRVRLRVWKVDISCLKVRGYADRAFLFASFGVEFNHSGDFLFQKVNDCGSVRFILDYLRSGSAPFAGEGSDRCHGFRISIHPLRGEWDGNRA